MDIQRAERLVYGLMAEHNLSGRDWWSFRWSRSKVIFGRCFHHSRRLELSRALVSLNSEAEVRDTILHEIAHALVGPGHGHDYIWRIKARCVGARPEACYDVKIVVPVPPRWLGECQGCHKQIGRHRISPRLLRSAYHPSCKQAGRPSDVQWKKV